MRIAMAVILVSAGLSSEATAQEKLAHTGNFESGRIQASSETHDGFYIRTLPNPQFGLEAILSGQGGFGPDSAMDTKVVSSEVVGSETVRPRKGKYFLRSALYYNKDYRAVNNGVLDKPRSMITLGNEVHRFDHDAEGYLGLSIYTPLNYEHETASLGDLGYVMLLSVNADTERTFFTVNQFVQAPFEQAHWWLNFYTSDSSTQEADARRTLIDLGPVSADLGKWTDFVVHYRSNPFSVETNPAAKGVPNAKNQTYPGNKGILELWKAEGPVDLNGNRKLVLKFSKVDAPVGLVSHSSEKLKITARVYKGGWKKHPTSVKGPVWFGFDEIRYGLVARDGTRFEDVNPAGVAGSQETTAPEPPKSLVVN